MEMTIENNETGITGIKQTKLGIANRRAQYNHKGERGKEKR
jgi:hypothetical protein